MDMDSVNKTIEQNKNIVGTSERSRGRGERRRQEAKGRLEGNHENRTSKRATLKNTRAKREEITRGSVRKRMGRDDVNIMMDSRQEREQTRRGRGCGKGLEDPRAGNTGECSFKVKGQCGRAARSGITEPEGSGQGVRLDDVMTKVPTTDKAALRRRGPSSDGGSESNVNGSKG